MNAEVIAEGNEGNVIVCFGKKLPRRCRGEHENWRSAILEFQRLHNELTLKVKYVCDYQVERLPKTLSVLLTYSNTSTQSQKK